MGAGMTTETPFPSSVELMLCIHAPLIDARQANSLAIEAAVAAMAPATKAAITADLKCYLGWCWSRHPRITAIPAAPETLVHYLRWLEKGSEERPPAKAATPARRIASIARMHRILGFGEKEPLPTQAGMVRDTLKGMRRNNRQRQQQAAPLRLGDVMAEGQVPPEGVTVRALLAACGSDIVSMRDAALISLAYDAGLRVSELVGTKVADLRQIGDMSGRLEIAHSKTDQEGQGALAWLSPDTMSRVSVWLLASGITEGPVFRRINLLSKPVVGEPGGPHLGYFALLSIGGIEQAQIARDAGFHLLHPPPDRGRCEIAAARVHRAKTATIYCYGPACDEAKIAAQQYEPPTRRSNSIAMITPEISNGLEIRRQLACQPHQLEVTASLAFQPSARLNLVQIAVNVELEQCRRMVARTSCRRCIGETERGQFQLFNKHINDADRAVLSNIIVHAGWQKKLLPPVTSLDKTTHPTPPDAADKSTTSLGFHTASTNFRRSTSCGRSLKADRQLRLDLSQDPTFSNRPTCRRRQVMNLRPLSTVRFAAGNDG
jgi:hypothetical protein